MSKIELVKAKEAEQVLSNPLYRQVMQDLRADLMTAFKATKFEQSDERDEIWRKLQTADWFEAKLERSLKTGKLVPK